MDKIRTAKAYRRRAEAREAERVKRHAALRQQAQRMATRLHEAFGSRARVYLLGSVLDPERFRTDSDLDLAIAGLEPPEYWEAWRIIEPLAEGTRIDLIRLERRPKRCGNPCSPKARS